MIDDLQQQIAKLVLEIVHRPALDGVGDLIGFFDGIGGDCRKGLLADPMGSRVPDREAPP